MKNIIFIIACFILVKCGESNKTDSVLESYFTDTELNIDIPDTLLVTDSLIKHNNIAEKTAVYILNSRCGSCLEQFVQFCNDMNGLNVPIFVIIYDHSDIMLKYLIEDFVKKENLSITILDNNDTYFKGSLNRYNNTVYVIDNGYVKNKFEYSTLK